nr:hypothetical protein CFP56_65362 [Quercus suber]
MWAFNFKLTLAILALRVCKPEGGRRVVTCLGAKDFRWPKALSGGPEITKHTGGLVKAQLMARDPIENGSVINGNVSVINGRPMWAFNFKLTLAILALRVCKPEGGRRVVTCLGAKDFRWPKALSGGPEITKHTGGLVKAQLMAKVSSLSEGTLVKPNSLKGSSDGQSSWVKGECLIGRSREDSGSPVTAVVPKSEDCAFALIGVANWRKRDKTYTLIAGVLRVGMMVRPMGPGFDVSSDHRHQGAAQNYFSPLSGLGSEKGLCFGERDDSMVVLGEKGEKWSNPIVEPMSPSHLDGVELLQEGSKHPLL